MATRTPQTIEKDYLHTLSTEKDDRTVQYHSGVLGLEDSNPSGGASSRKQIKKKLLPQALATRSSPRIRQNVRTSIGNQDKQDVTPRHIVIDFKSYSYDQANYLNCFCFLKTNVSVWLVQP